MTGLLQALAICIVAIIGQSQLRAAVRPVKAYLVYERYGSFLANELEGRVNAYPLDDMPAKSMVVTKAWYERRGDKQLIYAILERNTKKNVDIQWLIGMYVEDLIFSRVEYSDGTFIEKGKRR